MKSDIDFIQGFTLNNIPEISVIVCHHVGELVHNFIKSILLSEKVSFEIILISSDKNFKFLQEDNRLFKFHDSRLPASKRNYGASLAKGKYLAFFDDDTVINPSCLYNFKQSLESHQYSNTKMVYGKLLNMEYQNRFDEAGGFITWSGFIWSRAGQNDLDKGQYDHYEYILSGKSASCMVEKKTFNSVDGFDEGFGILGEETDLSWRIWLKGYKVLWCPDSVGLHAFNTKFKPVNQYYNSERVNFNGSRNYITMLIKNLGDSHLWIIPIHILIWFIVGLVMLITGKMKQGWNIWRGIGYVFANIIIILKKRIVIQTTRKINEKELWKTIHSIPPRSYYWIRISRYLRIGLHG